MFVLLETYLCIDKAIGIFPNTLWKNTEILISHPKFVLCKMKVFFLKVMEAQHLVLNATAGAWVESMIAQIINAHYDKWSLVPQRSSSNSWKNRAGK